MTGFSEEPNENVVVVGFCNVEFENINSFLDPFRKENNEASIQFFDAQKVAGHQHLYFAALNALYAFQKQTNISSNLAVECLIYASAQRQINKAMKMLGIKQDTSEVAALIIAQNSNQKENSLRHVTEKINGNRDDNVLSLTDKKVEKIKKLFNISDLEFEAKLKNQGLKKEALLDLIIERMALLVTKG